LSAALLNIALKVAVGVAVEKGNVTYKFKEIYAYAEGILVTAANTTAVKEHYLH
jgi:hypothetical protein